MKRTSIKRVVIYSAGLAIAVTAAIIAGILSTNVIDSLAKDDLKEADWCTFVVPSEFRPSTQPGVFMNKNHPMESSSIKYSIYENGQDIVLTNRQKEEVAINAPAVVDESSSLTKEIYEETISAAYNSEYSKDVGYSVSSFENINVNGYPGYRICADYQVPDEERIYQTVYMLLSKYKVFTVTYQRAEDDDCEALFEESASSIWVR